MSLDDTQDLTLAGRGVFITFEGIDGCGKSTQVALLSFALHELGVASAQVREPGGNAISEKIRTILLNPANTKIVPEAELLLYEASRAQNVREAIEPALQRGETVLCDRFYDSTFAYQGIARGLGEGIVRTANELGSCGITPAATIVFDLEPSVAWNRATQEHADRLEAEGVSFQERVREGYRRAAELEPLRVRFVDASGSREDVFKRMVERLVDVLPALEELDIEAFLERQAELERQMESITAAVGEGALDA